MSSIREVFLSANNKEYVYQNVCAQVQQETNSNLNNFPKYRQSFPHMMKKVHDNADPSTKGSVAALNRRASDKISNYFINQINKRQNQPSYTVPLLERPIRANTQAEGDIDSRLSDIQHERNQLNQQVAPNSGMNGPSNPIPIQDLENDKGETDKRYQQLLAARDAEFSTQNNSSNPIMGHPLPSNNEPIHLPPRPNINLNTQEVNHNSNSNSSNDDFNILPYTVSDDFNEQAVNLDQPLYMNAEDISSNTAEGTNDRYQELQKIRNSEINEFLAYQQTENSNQPVQNPSQIREGFQNPIQDKSQKVSNYFDQRTDIDRFNATRNETDINPADIYRIDQKPERNPNALRVNQSLEEKEAQTAKEFEEAGKLLKGNPLFDFFLEQIRDSKREYQDRPHYVVVSSEDRNWQNDVENRYDFLLNFNPSDSQSGAGIDTLYRNIVSIEVLKVIFPHDRLSVPFDNRVYLDLQSYPFLIMDIDEIDGVFHGSNNTLNEAFALLLFDKAFDSDVLTSDQISNTLTTTDTIKKRFARQFARGYMSFCPFLFEKKRYFNTPLASLNRLSIRFLRPDGQPISVDKDHLDISAIAHVDVADFELTGTNGFPRVNTGKYVRITTSTYFSNRTFRIGDVIKIRNYTLNTSDGDELKFQHFINRTEGHVIINLDQEFTGTSKNEGYINNIYIAPPGEVSATTGALDTSTHYAPTPADVSAYGTLINASMQVHITFKIVTREDKTQAVIKPINI